MRNFPLFPEQASTFAVAIDQIALVLTLLATFFFLLVGSIAVIFIWRYRRGSGASRAGAHDHHLGLELTWTLIPLAMALAMFFWAAKVYAEVYGPPPKEALEIFVMGKQWMWHLQHPNGIRENNELHIPVGRPVKLIMISQDVIHSFFVPAFRIKKDVLPGRYQTVWFIPTKVGKYRLFCAEYCGTQHSLMGGWIYVMEPTEYAQWLATGGGTLAGGVAAAGGTMEAAGEALFKQLGCNQCHDAPGAAQARCPSLKGLYGSKVKLQDGKTVIADDNYIRESILDPNAKIVAGYQPVMPNYANLLNEDKVLQLLAYIQSLSGTQTGGGK